MMDKLYKHCGIHPRSSFSALTLRIYDVALQAKIKMQRADGRKIGLYILLFRQIYESILLIAQVSLDASDKYELYQLLTISYLVVCLFIYERVPKHV